MSICLTDRDHTCRLQVPGAAPHFVLRPAQPISGAPNIKLVDPRPLLTPLQNAGTASAQSSSSWGGRKMITFSSKDNPVNQGQPGMITFGSSSNRVRVLPTIGASTSSGAYFVPVNTVSADKLREVEILDRTIVARCRFSTVDCK